VGGSASVVEATSFGMLFSLSAYGPDTSDHDFENIS
jgi:hypothetical protein